MSSIDTFFIIRDFRQMRLDKNLKLKEIIKKSNLNAETRMKPASPIKRKKRITKTKS